MMPNTEQGEGEPERQLDKIIAEYLQASDEGRPLDQADVLRRHPEFAAQLREFFVDAVQIAKFALPPSPDPDQTEPFSDSSSILRPPGTLVRYFGDYEILEELGVGGMGVVYKARQTKLNKIIALKMIKVGHLAGDDEVRRFRAEARAAAKLDHPGIVPVHEVGVDHGQHYYTMDYVGGVSLSKLHRDEPVAARRAALIIRQMAEAMHYAHGQGIVHRDLKPANVLLTAGGVPRITDFGLAKRLWSEDDSIGVSMTETGQILGTAGYMSPEQAAGKSRLVGPPADTYALGAVLYALLTGRAPFVGESQADTILQVIQRDPVSPRVLNPSIARDLETICLKCLEKEPHNRYGTTQLLADDLCRFLDGRPVTARPISPAARGWRWCCRNPWGATALLLLVILSVGSPSIAYEIDRQNKQIKVLNGDLKKELNDKQLALEQAASQRDRASKQLYLNHLGSAQREWEFKNFTAAWDHLMNCQSELRGWEHSYLAAKYTSGRIELPGHLREVTSVAFSPDGKRIASASRDRTIKVWNANISEDILTLKEHTVQVYGVAFAPDGKRIVSVGGDSKYYIAEGDGPGAESERRTGQLKVWDANTGNEILTKDVPDRILRCVALSPDGTLIAVGSTDGAIEVVDAASGEGVLTLKGHEQPVHSVAFSPDGKRIVSGSGYDEPYGNGANSIKVWDAVIGNEIRSLTGHSHAVKSVRFSLNGEKIVSGSMDKTIKVWDAANGEDTLTLRGHTGPVLSVAFNSDGERIVSSSVDGNVKIWSTIARVETMTLQGHTAPVLSVDFSPDGTQTVSGSSDMTVKLWDAVNGQEETTLYTGSAAEIDNMTFSHNGMMVASIHGYSHYEGESRNQVQPEQRLKAWNAHSGKVVLDINGNFGCLSFNSDDSRIVTGSGKTIRSWHSLTGEELLSVTLKQNDKFDKDPRWGGHFESMAFSPDTKRVVSNGFPRILVRGEELPVPGNGELTVWDTTTGEEIKTLNGRVGQVDGLVFNANGTQIASWEDKTINVWDLVSGEITLELNSDFGWFEDVAFSPDGKRIVCSSSDNTVKVLDTATGAELVALRARTGRVQSVAFSPDGKRIVCGSVDNTVTVWDAVTGEETITLRGHTGQVLKVAFSSDGMRVASGSKDEKIKLWPATNRTR